LLQFSLLQKPQGGRLPEISRKTGVAFLLAGSALLLAACGGGSSKRVYFGNLEDGSNVESPFRVDMKAENLIVEPATMGVNDGHGHFHIIVDAPLVGSSGPIPKDAKHIHYGAGETETTLDLPVGQHTLILQFAKGDHVSYDPPIFQQVQVNVTKQNVADTANMAKPVDTTRVKTGVDSLKAGVADTSAAKKADSAAKKADTAAVKATAPATPKK
jgi:hypothetical protein